MATADAIRLTFDLQSPRSTVSLSAILGVEDPGALLSASTPAPTEVRVETTSATASVVAVGWTTSDVSAETEQAIRDALTDNNGATFTGAEQVTVEVDS
jgi:hypothetical protein